ncbi:MAG: hypothetical protein O2894_05685 [Planctomycetota bacterium]|nr:hypothetical protein [Planctomycetota bacterium]
MLSSITHRNQHGGAGIIIIIVLVVLAIGAVGLFFLAKAGIGMIAEQVKVDIRDNPVIQEHIGEIQDISIDLTASGAAGGNETFVFDIKGTKGSGQLTATIVTKGADQEKVTAGTLRMADGTTHELFPK